MREQIIENKLINFLAVKTPQNDLTLQLGDDDDDDGKEAFTMPFDEKRGRVKGDQLVVRGKMSSQNIDFYRNN